MEEPILLVMSPGEFLNKIKILMEDVVDSKINNEQRMPSELAEKTLLLPQEVCQVLRISKTTLYGLVKEGTLKGFKIQRKRFFARSDVERMMRRQY